MSRAVGSLIEARDLQIERVVPRRIHRGGQRVRISNLDRSGTSLETAPSWPSKCPDIVPVGELASSSLTGAILAGPLFIAPMPHKPKRKEKNSHIHTGGFLRWCTL